MGYGSRALDLLEKYYEYNMINLDEPQPDDDEDEDRNGKGLRIVDEDTVGTLKPESKPRKLKLLLKLSERRPEKLDYLGVSFGLTGSLLKFWKKAGFIPLYLRQTANDLTGEYSCIMLKVLQSQSNADSLTVSDDWLQAFGASFRDRFISNLSGPFRDMSAQLALAMLHNRSVKIAHGGCHHHIVTSCDYFHDDFRFFFFSPNRFNAQPDAVGRGKTPASGTLRPQFGRLSFDHGYYADGRPTLLQRQAGRHPFECRSAGKNFANFLLPQHLLGSCPLSDSRQPITTSFLLLSSSHLVCIDLYFSCDSVNKLSFTYRAATSLDCPL